MREYVHYEWLSTGTDSFPSTVLFSLPPVTAFESNYQHVTLIFRENRSLRGVTEERLYDTAFGVVENDTRRRLAHTHLRGKIGEYTLARRVVVSVFDGFGYEPPLTTG